MAVAAGGAVLCLVLLGIFRKRDPTAAKMAKIALLFCALGAFAAANEKWNPLLKENGVLVRNENGDGAYEAQLTWRLDGEEEPREMTVRVEEQELSDGEAEELLRNAETEIDETFLGENTSLGEIRTDVCMKSAYQDGLVTAEWSFDSYEWVDADGNVKNEEIPEEGALVKAAAELECGEKKEEYEFFFHVYPKLYTGQELVEKQLGEEVEKRTADTKSGEIQLPETVDGKKVVWEQVNERLPEKLALLGVIAAACIPLVERSRRQEREKKRKQQLQMEYPELVSKLSILIGSSMTLYAAWSRIASGYETKRKAHSVKPHPLYEEMLITCREIESGAGEVRAFEKFGERCGLHLYRKFCSLLIQNLRKGTRGLTALLEQEVAVAFEERKNTAKKYGEEAGTKMLLPMMLMFGIVIAVIMIPAAISMQQ